MSQNICTAVASGNFQVTTQMRGLRVLYALGTPFAPVIGTPYTIQDLISDTEIISLTFSGDNQSLPIIPSQYQLNALACMSGQLDAMAIQQFNASGEIESLEFVIPLHMDNPLAGYNSSANSTYSLSVTCPAGAITVDALEAIYLDSDFNNLRLYASNRILATNTQELSYMGIAYIPRTGVAQINAIAQLGDNDAMKPRNATLGVIDLISDVILSEEWSTDTIPSANDFLLRAYTGAYSSYQLKAGASNVTVFYVTTQAAK